MWGTSMWGTVLLYMRICVLVYGGGGAVFDARRPCAVLCAVLLREYLLIF